MAIISELSENEAYKVTLDTVSGAIEVKNQIENTWISGVIPEESISIVEPLVVPGFENGNVLYAIGYYIASKISGGSSAK
jgi:hypothetical protein